MRFDVDDRGRLITKTVHLVVLGLAANLAACAPARTSCPVRPPSEPVAADTEAEEGPKSELAAEIEDAGLEPRPAFGPSRRSKKLPFHLRGPHRGGGGGHLGR